MNTTTRTAATFSVTIALLSLALTGCSREAVLGSDVPPTHTAPRPATSPTPKIVPGTPTTPAPTGKVGAPWTPDLTDWSATLGTVDNLLRDPGCTDSREMATRLETVWRLWYGKTVRHAQPDYPDLVLKPIERITITCGPEYAQDVYKNLNYLAPVILERIQESATKHQSSTPTGTPTPSIGATPTR